MPLEKSVVMRVVMGDGMSDCLYKQSRRVTSSWEDDLSGRLPNCLWSMLGVMSSFIQVAATFSAILVVVVSGILAVASWPTEGGSWGWAGLWLLSTGRVIHLAGVKNWGCHRRCMRILVGSAVARRRGWGLCWFLPHAAYHTPPWVWVPGEAAG